MERKKSSNRKRNRAAVDVDSVINRDKSVNNTNNNGGNSAGTGGTRKPFTDLVNFNLISPQTIRKLRSTTISATEADSIRRKSRDQNFPSPQFPTNSKPQTVSDSDSRSATSIDSSNVKSAPNTQPENPFLIPRSSCSSKSPNPTGKKSNISSHSRAVENLKGPKKNDVSLHTSTSSKKTMKQEKAIPVRTSSEKVNDKQKTIAVSFDSSPTGIVIDKGKGIFANFSSSIVETPSENAKDKGKAIAVPFDSTPTGIVTDKGKGISINFSSSTVETASEKAKDKGKAIAVPFDSTPTRIVRDKGKGISVNFSSSTVETTSEKAKDKGKAIAVPFDSGPTGIVTDKGKGIAINLSSSTAETTSEKAKDKGNAIAVPFDSGPTGIVTDKGKETSINLSSSTAETTSEKAKDKGKAIAVPFDSAPTVIVTDKGKGISVNFSSSTVETTSDEGTAVYVPFSSTLGEKRKDKGKAPAHEELEGVGKSTPVLMNSKSLKKTKENKEADDIALSCPPRLLRTRNIGNRPNQDEEINASKSWTAPRGKAKKKKYSRQQSDLEYEEEMRKMKAYFAEIDAFELPVEEASGYDSDY